MSFKEYIQKKQPDKRYTYRKIDGLDLPMHVYFPPCHNNKDLKPVIICIHGGAWGGRKDNTEWNGDYMNTLARYFAIRGAIGITFSYRNVYNPRKEAELFNNGPELFDLYDDCLAALRYIRKSSKELGIDINKIAVIGDSAGGHLAACLGTLDILRKADDIKPAFVIACNPITDLTDPQWFEYVSNKTRYSEFSNLSREDRANLISPIYNITQESSQMFVIHGTDDTVVAPRHSVEFYENMIKVNDKCRLELIEGASHAFILPEYYPDKGIVLKSIKIIDNYFCNNGILYKNSGGESNEQ